MTTATLTLVLLVLAGGLSIYKPFIIYIYHSDFFYLIVMCLMTHLDADSSNL